MNELTRGLLALLAAVALFVIAVAIGLIPIALLIWGIFDLTTVGVSMWNIASVVVGSFWLIVIMVRIAKR